MSKSKGSISKGVDGLTIWLYLLLVCIGLIAIFAVTYKEGDAVISSFFSFKTDYSKQFYFFLIAIVIGIFILLTDSKFFPATANVWYAVGIVLLLLVFPFHSRVKGTESIIRFGGFQFQPAEFCKVCVCLALAKYLSLPNMDFTKTRSQLIAAAIAIFPALLSIMQSETGLALVYFSFFLVMYREGLPATILIVGFSFASLVVATLLVEKNTLALVLTALAALLIYSVKRQLKRDRGLLFKIIFIWAVCVGIQRFAVPFIFKHVLHSYQVERIFSTIGKDVPQEYINPKEALNTESAASKKKDVDYNVKQSKIAIGSGGLLGKGLLRGTQTRYDFVPEQRTDFIFCTVGEGFGFIGTTTLLLI
jgi:rod shape determining protein RodA